MRQSRQILSGRSVLHIIEKDTNKSNLIWIRICACYGYGYEFLYRTIFVSISMTGKMDMINAISNRYPKHL